MSSEPIEGDCDPWRNTCLVTLQPSTSEVELLEIETNTVARAEFDPEAEVEPGLMQAHFAEDRLILRVSAESASLCPLFGTFGRASDVPADPCGPCRALYGCSTANYAVGDRGLVGAGFSLHLEDGDAYRVRIYAYEEGGDDVTLEYAAAR